MTLLKILKNRNKKKKKRAPTYVFNGIHHILFRVYIGH